MNTHDVETLYRMDKSHRTAAWRTISEHATYLQQDGGDSHQIHLDIVTEIFAGVLSRESENMNGVVQVIRDHCDDL